MTKIIIAVVLTLLTSPAMACNGGGNCDNAPGREHANSNSVNNTHGVPGPIAGAGLPILAIGYGVYWLVKRRRDRMS